MPDKTLFPGKTYSPADLLDPSVKPMAADLRRFALRLGLSGTRFAVNGILRHRFWVRRNKLWEYARGVDGLLCSFYLAEPEKNAKPRVLDFGGAATLPILYLAEIGCEVLCLDIDAALTNWTNEHSKRRGWKLHASTHNLVTTHAPAEWGLFDAVISFSVLEHIPKAAQPLILERLAKLLKPGGIFALTFDFGPEAPVQDAVRDLTEVERLVAATGLDYLDGQPLTDTGERFALDRRHPSRRFTFASLFLKKRSSPARTCTE
ncbi:MAG: class I SAM-dependent methyltransferase [Acidobacteria bacterium]|nr:class I SAM-dependent methyltransferase [Acidobacteriota bacterium]MCL5288292.1 class I SAM-dependent methyltransferase [Acidobacteriota bacterium]